MTAPDLIDRLRRAAGQGVLGQGVLSQGTGSSDYDLNPDLRPANRALRGAAVLIALEEAPGGMRLYLTKRASHLKHHPGQIALPGGKIDPTDAGPVAAALREAREEIGLPPEQVETLGTRPPHETVTGFAVTPVLARITKGFTPVPEAGEVDEVFSVPLAHVLDPGQYIVEQRFFRGQPRQFYTVPYGPYYIWGATARILRSLADDLAA